MEIIRLFHRVSHKLGKRKEADEKKHIGSQTRGRHQKNQWNLATDGKENLEQSSS